MAIKFVAICPHPPIIIPGVGNEQDLDKAFKTIHALKSLSNKFKEQKIETVIVFTPHGNALENILVYSSNSFTASLPGALFGFSGDLELSEEISKIKGVKKATNGDLDHGSAVPLYYFKQAFSSFKIVPISYSCQSPSYHFNFGKKLYKLIEKSDKNIAIIGSGDFCHRLSPSAPAGFSAQGKEFDENLLSLIKNDQVDQIISLDPSSVEQAAQCAHKSILMLLGTINSLKYKPEVISYESPFGVGYAVVEYQLHKKIDENKD